MNTVDPKDRLEGDWEPSQIPDLRPDAPAVEPPKLRVLPPEPPSLCAQGPCVHYHEVSYEMDAQKPLDHSEASSKSHRMRTCYPSSGIEMPLDAAVFECNLWLPSPPKHEDQRETQRLRYMQSGAGEAYRADLEAWNLEQERIRKEESELASVDATELDMIEELRATMDGDDVLQVRRKGEPDLLCSISKGDVFMTVAYLTAALLGSNSGPGDYQIRHVRKKSGMIAAIKILTIESDPLAPPAPEQETPE